MMEETPADGTVVAMSSWELVSVYINRSYGDNLALKAALEAELAARKLPLPGQMPPRVEPAPSPAAMTKATFLEYILLTYLATGILYSWFFLPLHLLKGDFRVDRKHKLIQSGIALAYQAAELVAGLAIAGEL
jgi:hypothetical protein